MTRDIVRTREIWWSAAQVKLRYGVTDTTIDRWLATKLFPKPGKYVGKRRYWRGSELDQWDAYTALKQREAC